MPNTPLVVSTLHWFELAGVEGDLQRLKPHQEGLLLPIIHQYRKMHHSAEGFSKQEDRRVDFIAALVAKYSTLSDENIMAVAIVRFFLPLVSFERPGFKSSCNLVLGSHQQRSKYTIHSLGRFFRGVQAAFK